MDAPYFGLQKLPFPTTPDSTCYYPATGHEHVLDQLLKGLKRGEGMLVVTGEPGAGKTLLGYCLLERLGAEVISAFLTNSHFGGYQGLLQGILFELSLPYQGLSEQEMRLALTDHLLSSYSHGKTMVLVVDEAQHLSVDLLEELRLLSNLEARGGKALQIVLLGQPSFLETLQKPELGSLRQRLSIRCQLSALDVDEAADYVLCHLRAAGTGCPESKPAGPDPGQSGLIPIAGGERVLFTDEALELLARASEGIPRVLNQTADKALLLAHEAEAHGVDVEVILEVIEGMGLQVPECENEEAASLSHPALMDTSIDIGYSGVSFSLRPTSSDKIPKRPA